MEKEIIKLTLRLPAEVKQKIEEIAKEEDRSLNEQVIHILKAYLAQQEKKKK